MALPIYDLSVRDDTGPRLLAGLGNAFLTGQRQAQESALANRKMQVAEEDKRLLGSLAGVDPSTPDGMKRFMAVAAARGDLGSVMQMSAQARKQANEEKFTRDFFGTGQPSGGLGALGTGGAVPMGGPLLRSSGVQVANTEAEVQRLEAEMEGRSQYGDPNQPRGLRNNNPGNIEAGNFAAGVPGYQGSDGRFAKFSTPEQGIQATDKLLQSYAGRGLNTVAGIVNRWAPPNENNTGAYAASVAKELGVTPDQPLDMANPETRRRLMQAKFRVENGSQPYGESVFMRAYGGQPSQMAAGPQVPAQPVQMAQADTTQADIPAGAPVQGFNPPGGQQAGNGLPPNDPRPDLSNQQLQYFMSAPGAPDSVKAQAKFILERRLKYSDDNSPLKTENMRLQNKKLERELQTDGARPMTPEERKNYSVPEGQSAFIKKNGEPGFGPANMTIKNEGTLPPGYKAVRDANGNVERLEPIPGSKAATEAKEAADKQSKSQRMRYETGNVVNDQLNDIDRLMKEATFPVAGPIGSRLSGVPGTASHDISQALTTVGANISFDKLQQMREASPTGGALGAVTERELDMLKNSYAALSQSQRAQQFKSNLGRVRAVFERTIHGRTLSTQERRTGGPMTADKAQSLRTEAMEAIKNGAPRAQVMKRLYDEFGVPPEGL